MTAHPPSDPAAEAEIALDLGPVPPPCSGDLRRAVRDCIGETIPLRRRWVSAIMERVIAPLVADIAALRTRAEEADRVCDSYARENQQFHDRFTAAETSLIALARMYGAACGQLWVKHHLLQGVVDEGETQIEAMHQKIASLSAHETCACSYDKPGDVCMHHSPALTAAEVRAAVAEAKAEIRDDVMKAEGARADRLATELAEARAALAAKGD